MSKRGHIPIRMCVGCRSRKRKEEMIRFTPGNERGAYLCPDLKCLKRAEKKDLIDGRAISLEAFIRQRIDVEQGRKGYGKD